MLNTQLVKENFAENATLFNFSYTMTIDVLRSLCVHGNLLQQFVFFILLTQLTEPPQFQERSGFAAR